jgi:hypothetical protein
MVVVVVVVATAAAAAAVLLKKRSLKNGRRWGRSDFVVYKDTQCFVFMCYYYSLSSGNNWLGSIVSICLIQ